MKNEFARDVEPGMGQAVAERTVFRRKADGSLEVWADVADRVARGNAYLFETAAHPSESEYHLLRKHISSATTLMSGRHLQHGDEHQSSRNMEVFTNCGRGDTRLLTLEHGVTTLAEISGESVTVRGADGKWHLATAKAYGEQDVYRLVFARVGTGVKQTREVFFTRNHRWLLADGSVTDEIHVGQKLACLPVETAFDDDGLVHGIIFGDGTAHKRRCDYKTTGVSQGRTYASIRVCKKGEARTEMMRALDNVGFSCRYPTWANSDPVYYLGKQEGFKDLPFTSDPHYITGFIRGWWLADGHKTEPNGTWTISTARSDAAEWLCEHSAYAGLTVVSHTIKERKDGDGSYKNGQDLHVVRLREGVQWQLEQIEYSSTETVYCVEEPVTKSFTLANGLLTGNCATSAASFLLFYLLLNGSGVGRCYDDDMMLVNWDNAPTIRCVLDSSHADFDWSAHESLRDAQHKYSLRENTVWFEVPDSREGWAKALEIWEVMAFEKIHKDKMLILDFSKVRPKGTPIGGMQNRPASGPVSLMNAFQKAGSLKGANLAPWKQAMYIDHYFAECVLVGGARRAARMSTKIWSDPTVLEFVVVKRPIEYHGLPGKDIIALRENNPFPPLGFLWSSNNSVMVDDEFWSLVGDTSNTSERALHARKVCDLICEAAYCDGTGEPGIINAHKLVQKDDGWKDLNRGDYVGSLKYRIDDDTHILFSKLAKRAKSKKYHTLTNPCGEIALNVLGGYCVIADVVPFHAETLDEAEETFRVVTRALMRVNLMDSMYRQEVQRTNRIGVGITGIHEFAWKFFRLGFRDLIDEDKSREFWLTMARFNRAVHDEAVQYAKELNVNVPHTMTTVKPAGTTSKLFLLTEGWHLPSMREFLRWVQFRNDDPLVKDYRDAGYPVRELVQYSGTTIVGFPTAPAITRLGMGDKLITAAEATPEEQFQWLMLGEKYWIHGTDENGEPLKESYGNQVSYTLKIDPRRVSVEEFKEIVREYQSKVRCCSILLVGDTSSYEYLPEQPVTNQQFQEIEAAIKLEDNRKEDVGFEHVDCASGACPVSWNENEAAQDK